MLDEERREHRSGQDPGVHGRDSDDGRVASLRGDRGQLAHHLPATAQRQHGVTTLLVDGADLHHSTDDQQRVSLVIALRDQHLVSTERPGATQSDQALDKGGCEAIQQRALRPRPIITCSHQCSLAAQLSGSSLRSNPLPSASVR